MQGCLLTIPERNAPYPEGSMQGIFLIDTSSPPSSVTWQLNLFLALNEMELATLLRDAVMQAKGAVLELAKRRERTLIRLHVCIHLAEHERFRLPIRPRRRRNSGGPRITITAANRLRGLPNKMLWGRIGSGSPMCTPEVLVDPLLCKSPGRPIIPGYPDQNIEHRKLRHKIF